MVNSTAMLLDHLSAKHKDDQLKKAARLLTEKADQLLMSKSTRTPDLGGGCSTSKFGDALVDSIIGA